MAFWSSELLKKHGPSLINKFEENRVQQGSYELSLGTEVYLTSDKPQVKKILKEGEQISIPAGQFALLLTQETVTVPPEALGLISIKSATKLMGLVNVSGFHVDPGFNGKLLFSVYNAGSRPIPITQGKPLFLIWFAYLSGVDSQGFSTVDTYKGKNTGMSCISDTYVSQIQGDVASPNVLKEEIEKVKASLKEEVDKLKAQAEFTTWALRLIAGVFFTLVLGTAIALVNKMIDKQAPQTATEPAGIQKSTSDTVIPAQSAAPTNVRPSPSSLEPVNTKSSPNVEPAKTKDSTPNSVPPKPAQ